MKKIFSLIILSILCITQIYAEIAWTFDGNTLIISGTGEVGNSSWKHLRDAIRTVIINNGVTSIGDNAFGGCKNLENITIPNSLTKIGNYAFSGCTSLSTITIPNSVTSIGYDAFSDCSSLTSVFIPKSVENINSWVFTGCTNLASIVVDKENVYYDSRNNCNAIIRKEDNTLIQGCNNTIIPNSVTSIGQAAFYGCKYLASITIPNSVISIGDHAFYGCRSLCSITIPSSVTYIENTNDDVFEGCYMMADKFVNNSDCYCSITTIDTEQEDGLLIKGDEVIGCRAWATSVTIPNHVTSIGESAFQGCSRITSVKIPNSVTTINKCAFYECYNLVSVTIPNCVTNIGSHAFFDCSSLTSIFIPQSVENIDYGAFSGCSNLISITVDDDNAYYDSRNNCNAIICKKDNRLIIWRSQVQALAGPH